MSIVFTGLPQERWQRRTLDPRAAIAFPFGFGNTVYGFIPERRERRSFHVNVPPSPSLYFPNVTESPREGYAQNGLAEAGGAERLATNGTASARQTPIDPLQKKWNGQGRRDFCHQSPMSRPATSGFELLLELGNTTAVAAEVEMPSAVEAACRLPTP